MASHTVTPLGTWIIAAPAHIQDPAERLDVDITLNPQPTDAASSIFHRAALLCAVGRSEIGGGCASTLRGNKLRHGRHGDLAEPFGAPEKLAHMKGRRSRDLRNTGPGLERRRDQPLKLMLVTGPTLSACTEVAAFSLLSKAAVREDTKGRGRQEEHGEDEAQAEFGD